MDAMTASPPPEYVLARSVLLDALQALGPQVDALVLVGAQAVYLHTGDADLIVVPTTTDADLALFPAKLLDEPLLEDALRAAGFALAANPGAWRGRFGVAVDLMVPEALSGGSSRRSAQLPVHGSRAARRTTGLEPALVDNEIHELVAFEAADPRTVRLRVAGSAALLVAKVTKIEERRGNPARHRPKDGLDVLRLLQSTSTAVLAQRLADLVRDPLAGEVAAAALAALRRDGRDPAGLRKPGRYRRRQPRRPRHHQGIGRDPGRGVARRHRCPRLTRSARSSGCAERVRRLAACRPNGGSGRRSSRSRTRS